MRWLAELPVVSVRRSPLRASLTRAAIPIPAALIACTTSSRVSAVERSTVAVAPLRSVSCSAPSCPSPLPPLRLESSTVWSPPSSRRPVMTPPAAAPSRPRSAQRLRVVQRLEREGSFARGQVGDDQALPVGGDLGFELPRVGSIDPLEDVAEGFLGRGGAASRGQRREVDRPRGAVAEGVRDVGQQRAGQHAIAVVEFRQRGVLGKPEDVLSLGRPGSHVDAREPERGGGRAASHLLDLQIGRVLAGIVLEADPVAIGRGSDVDRRAAVDGIQDVVDRLGRGEVDYGAGAAPVGDADLAGDKARAVAEHVQACVARQVIAEAEGERAPAERDRYRLRRRC